MSDLNVPVACAVEIEPRTSPVDSVSLAPTQDHMEIEIQPYSARILGIIQRFRRFDNPRHAEIESSRDYWSELVTSASDDEPHETNRAIFEKLRKDPEYCQFFGLDFSHLKLGPKFAEGGQAEIFEAIDSVDSCSCGKGKLALKVFKKGFSLQDLPRQWPRGMLRSSSAAGFSVAGALRIEGGIVSDDDRFGFVLPRYWGDLRTLMDIRMQHRNPLIYKPPFEASDAVNILYTIALGMKGLHEQRICHRDLKASNILVRLDSNVKPTARTLCFDNLSSVFVADYECSVGVVGTGFWRAPEILCELKNGNHWPRFTAAADVYSFGMVSYEVLTGSIPFEGHRISDYDLVLKGNRPRLWYIAMPWAKELIRRCWQHDPSKRPTFDELEAELKRRKMLIDHSCPLKPVGRIAKAVEILWFA